MNRTATTRYQTNPGMCRSQGFTLIEIMISTTVSLILVAATLTLFANQQEAVRHVSSMVRVQENGRFALDVLARNLRMARYDDKIPVAVLINVEAGVGANGISGQDSPGGAGFSAVADAVTTYYEGGSDIRDCQGREVNENESVKNEFRINDADELECTATHYEADGDIKIAIPISAQTIAEGIEDIQLLYGEDVSETGLPNRFVAAADVTDWSKIVSVRVALLLNSVTPVTRVAETNCMACDLFNPAADRRTRAEFTTSVGIRNLNI